ncbi:Ca-activated chloride channel family protein OS=Streptomyces violarus OX=67380 GN=FHS41_003733 PE=4 SV=1 [Streptomyces violarus]
MRAARPPTATSPGLPAPAHGDQDGTSEQEDQDREAAPDNLSTFALDGDTASYDYARRALADGRLPDPSTVRPEEFGNNVRQDYERPDGDRPPVPRTAPAPPTRTRHRGRVGLATRTTERTGERPPAARTFVIDVSGSMAEPGRLDLAQESLTPEAEW